MIESLKVWCFTPVKIWSHRVTVPEKKIPFFRFRLQHNERKHLSLAGGQIFENLSK